MNIYYIIYFDFMQKRKERVKMCDILETLKGKDADYVLDTWGSRNSFPIDVVSVAKKIGIQLGSIDFTDLEKTSAFKDLVNERGHILGAVFVDEEDVQIVYSNKLPNEKKFKHLSDDEKREKLLRRQRFTIAHELAHCCLHMNGKENDHIEFRTDQINYDDPDEFAANIFAGELLIPTDIIVTICNILKNNIRISQLSDIFRVSKHVMNARIKYLQEEKKLLRNCTFV